MENNVNEVFDNAVENATNGDSFDAGAAAIGAGIALVTFAGVQLVRKVVIPQCKKLKVKHDAKKDVIEAKVSDDDVNAGYVEVEAEVIDEKKEK